MSQLQDDPAATTDVTPSLANSAQALGFDPNQPEVAAKLGTFMEATPLVARNYEAMMTRQHLTARSGGDAAAQENLLADVRAQARDEVARLAMAKRVKCSDLLTLNTEHRRAQICKKLWDQNRKRLRDLGSPRDPVLGPRRSISYEEFKSAILEEFRHWPDGRYSVGEFASRFIKRSREDCIGIDPEIADEELPSSAAVANKSGIPLLVDGTPAKLSVKDRDDFVATTAASERARSEVNARTEFVSKLIDDEWRNIRTQPHRKPDVWRDFRSEFKALRADDNQRSPHLAILGNQYSGWRPVSDIDVIWRSFEELSGRCGAEFSCPPEVRTSDFWLHLVLAYLKEHGISNRIAHGTMVVGNGPYGAAVINNPIDACEEVCAWLATLGNEHQLRAPDVSNTNANCAQNPEINATPEDAPARAKRRREFIDPNLQTDLATAVSAVHPDAQSLNKYPHKGDASLLQWSNGTYKDAVAIKTASAYLGMSVRHVFTKRGKGELAHWGKTKKVTVQSILALIPASTNSEAIGPSRN